MKDVIAKDRLAQRREDRRKAIIEVAQRAFLKHGYADTSMSAIAALCGGSKTTLWAHFPSKEDLFQAFIDKLVGDFSAALGEALLTGGGTSSALLRFGEVYIAKITSEDTRALRRLITAEGHRIPTLMRSFYENGPRRTRERLARYMGEEMKGGRLRRGDPELAACQFLGLCQSGCFADVIWHRPGGPGSSPAIDAEHAVEAFFRIWSPTE